MSSSQPKILFVLTSEDKLPNGRPGGWYLPECAHPYDVLSPHADITIASPKGGVAPLDQGSVETYKSDTSCVNFLEKHRALWEKTRKLEDCLGHAKEYEAIFFVGGHGPMFDLATDAVSQKLILEFHNHNRIISAVCHGPVALVNVKHPDGSYLLAGQPVTGFSNTEEDTLGMSAVMPFMLQDRLEEVSGGRYEKAAEDWKPKVVVAAGGMLITGQNPASAGPIGQAIYDAIFGESTGKS